MPSDLVTRAGGALVVQAGTATSTRVREQEQSFNTIDIADGGVTVTLERMGGERLRAGRCPALRMAGRALAHIESGSSRRIRRGTHDASTEFDLDEFVPRVLAEDLGTGGDVTSTRR